MLGPSDATADLLRPRLAVLLSVISASLYSLLCLYPSVSHPEVASQKNSWVARHLSSVCILNNR